MDPNEIQAALAEAVEEVLETMCFATVLASAEGVAPPGRTRDATGGGNSLTAQLDFQGDFSGVFRFSTSLDLGRSVAAGFLGVEETEVSNQQACQVVAELANMVCGAVLSRLEPKTTFRLCQPGLTLGEGSVVMPESARWFDLGCGILAATLDLRLSI